MSEARSENLSAHQSLDIITDMIKQAKGNMKRNSFFFLFWGWIVVIANLGMYALIQIEYPMPYIVWSVTLPAWIFTMYKVFRRKREQHFHTHLDRIHSTVWIVFGVCIFTFILFSGKLNHQVNPLIVTLAAIPTMVSGVILRFRPLTIGSCLLWVFGITGFMTPMEYQNLIGAAAIICGYLVPGYMLKNKKED